MISSFAIAHELYHYYTKSGSHLSRLDDEENSLIEAEEIVLLLSFYFQTALKSIILDEFKTSKLEKLSEKTISRFIVRLQCTWWLPYHSIVKRLHEIGAISEEQYKNLYAIDERNLDEEYGEWELLSMKRFLGN